MCRLVPPRVRAGSKIGVAHGGGAAFGMGYQGQGNVSPPNWGSVGFVPNGRCALRAGASSAVISAAA